MITMTSLFGKISTLNDTKKESLIILIILTIAATLSFIVRLFPVIQYENVIHEFDPYFNYRSTRYLVEKGFYSFHNWFDEKAWYPLGRDVGVVPTCVIGCLPIKPQPFLLTHCIFGVSDDFLLTALEKQNLALYNRTFFSGGANIVDVSQITSIFIFLATVYPGLMITSAVIYHLCWFLHISIDILNVCVFLPALFSSFTTLITYLLTKEIKNASAGLVAASLISIVPGYISRSIAGSYDNEAIAIFCMLLTYYTWIKAVKTGTILWGTLCALAYLYMVSSWGGYVFLINIIPLHVLLLMITGRFSYRIYVAYNTLYCIGTILSMQISFVNFQPIQSSEHMLAFGVFGLCQIISIIDYLRSKLSSEDFEKIYTTLFYAIGIILVGFIGVLTFSGKISPLTGRFYTLLDPYNTRETIPLIDSISEHKPTGWGQFYYDLHILLYLFPAGLYFCFKELNDVNIFLILYGVTSMYFTGIMIRLMLVLAPAMCIGGGIGASHLLTKFMKIKECYDPKNAKAKSYDLFKKIVAVIFALITCIMFITFTIHSVWVTYDSYSEPDIILSEYSDTNERFIVDDFREAYYWLKMNTPEDARIMAWWDYGYQISALANRTVIVDNNTWNNTHISRVAQAMVSNEQEAYKIMKELNVNYVLVLFGGYWGYSSDDMAKFLWMVRIGASTEEGEYLDEDDYYSDSGYFKVNRFGSPVLFNSLTYKMSYYRFGNVITQNNRPPGFDQVRRTVIGHKKIKLEVLEEAYTSENWLIRIYKVKDRPNRY